MLEKIVPMAFRVRDAAHALSISRSSIYNMINKGQLKSVKIAGRRLIKTSEIERLLTGDKADA